MLIFAIDDEENVLEEAVEIIARAAEGAQIRAFRRGAAALEAIQQGSRPDVVFCDIEMPGITGLEFAVRLKELSPNTRIVFATAFEKYAVEAFRVKAHGYLLKPLDEAAIRTELAWLPGREETAGDRLVIRCFGHFDVFWRGEPVVFARKQSKELLAYLIDRRGAACTTEEITLALWENGADRKTEQNRFRVILNDLKSTLKKIGQEEILLREHRQLAIRTDRVDCDYYRMLDGDMDALNAYHGEYMTDYSWAELTNAQLHFRK